MIDQLLDAVKGNIGSILTEDGFGMDKLDDVLKLSGESVQEGVIGEATSGNLDGVLSLFQGKSEASASNPIVSGIISSMTGKLTSSLGFGQGEAGGLAGKVIPMIVQTLISKFSGSGNDVSVEGITSFLGGVDSDDLLNKAKGMLGGLFN